MTNENKTNNQELSNINKNQLEGNKSLGEKIKENIGNIVFVVVLIGLIVGAYVYSQKSQQKAAEETKQTSQEEQKKEETKTEEKKAKESVIEDKETSEKTQEKAETTETAKTEEETISVSGDIYTVKAESGDGITHLARKALKDYLKQNSNKNLTKEQKIYIEDYMQNATGTEMLEIGETRTFSKSLIEEAITASESLTPAQLDNLKQYSSQVSDL